MNEILNSCDLAEQGHPDIDPDNFADVVATHEPENKGMEFHVSLRDYTMRDMESVIIEVAVNRILDRTGKERLAKVIEERCLVAIRERADAQLATLTKEIMDQPLSSASGPVTMREFLALVGRDYLTQQVDREGKPAEKSGWGHSSTQTRAAYLVSMAMQHQFKEELDKTTRAVVVNTQGEIRRAHQALLDKQSADLREALEKITNPKNKVSVL